MSRQAGGDVCKETASKNSQQLASIRGAWRQEGACATCWVKPSLPISFPGDNQTCLIYLTDSTLVLTAVLGLIHSMRSSAYPGPYQTMSPVKAPCPQPERK